MIVTDRFLGQGRRNALRSRPGRERSDRGCGAGGTVEIAAADGRSWRVHAGQRWVSSEPAQLGASAIADPVKLLLEDGLSRANASDLDRELQAVGRVSPVPPANAKSELALAPAVAGAPARVSLSSERAERRTRRASADSSRAEVRSSQLDSPAAPVVSAPSGEAAAPPPLVVAEREPIPGDRSSAPSAQLTFEKTPALLPTSDGAYARGLALERRGQLKEAAAELARAETDDPARPRRSRAVCAGATRPASADRLARSAGPLSRRYRVHYPLEGPCSPRSTWRSWRSRSRLAIGKRRWPRACTLPGFASGQRTRTDEVRLYCAATCSAMAGNVEPPSPKVHAEVKSLGLRRSRPLWNRALPGKARELVGGERGVAGLSRTVPRGGPSRRGVEGACR